MIRYNLVAFKFQHVRKVPNEECGVHITRILLCTRTGYTYIFKWSDLWLSSSDIRSLNVLKGAVHCEKVLIGGWNSGQFRIK